MKKSLLLKFLGLLSFLFFLNGCGGQDTSSYDSWKRTTPDHTYHSQACPKSDLQGKSKRCGLGASATSQAAANSSAMKACRENNSDCIVTHEGNKLVYSADDANRVQMAKLIEESKSTCISLGFSKGTDKFTDCTLKLYSQKLDLAEKQNQQVVVQNQGSSTVRVIDVTRERENTMRKAGGLIDGSCTLATYYKC